MDHPLASFVLSAYPPGSTINDSVSYRPGYMPYPARVTVRTATGGTEHCVLKMSEQLEEMEREAGVLTMLATLGVPVPVVLAGPTATAAGAMALMSEAPGTWLPWDGALSLDDADLTCRLLIAGVDWLHELTPQVAQHALGRTLPRFTLMSERSDIVSRGGPWLEVDVFAQALQLLRQVLPHIDTPLVFSNGDYNPFNFLHAGDQLTALLDFAGACFEDPYIGFAKFLIWGFDGGWSPGMKSGLVERYLYAHHVGRAVFAPRLVLRCLRHLQHEVSLTSEQDAQPRAYMLRVLAEGMAGLNC